MKINFLTTKLNKKLHNLLTMTKFATETAFNSIFQTNIRPIRSMIIEQIVQTENVTFNFS